MRAFNSREFSLPELLARKHETDSRISICLPARDEAATVGDVVAAIPDELADEIVVIDDGSTDDTAAVAQRAGARVVTTKPGGKGAAMRRGLDETSGDVVVYLDADVRNFGPHFVIGLVGPLLVDDTVSFVKAHYQRPVADGPEGGGRVTELMAKPLLRVLFPELSSLRQPLSGEIAARRTLLEKLTFADGYAVDLALVLDAVDIVGVDAFAEVDLGSRVHRNRPLSELAPQAEEILRMALDRAAQRK